MIKHLSIIITLITATLYVLGLTYYQSFLRSLGIEETQFPLSIDRVLFQGFVSSANMGFKALVWFYLTAFGVVAVALVGMFVFDLFKEHKLLKLINDKRVLQKNETKAKSSFTDFALKMFEYVSGVLVVFIGVFVVLIVSDNIGKEAAKNTIEKCANGELPQQIVRLANKQKEVSGCPIVCNSSQCAYLTADRVLVINKEGRIYSYSETKL